MANYELGNLIWRIRGETADFNKNISTANKRMTAFGEKTKKIGKSFTTFLTAPIVGAGIAATKAASDLGESINAVSVVFGDSAETINEWGKDAADNAGLSRTAFNELATVIGAQLKQSGLEIDEVADSTIELTQRSADLASVFNVDVQEATTALGAALRGESEPARRFGINISDAAVQAEALASGLVESKDQIDDQIKVQARYNLIMKQSSDVAGDFQNTSDSLANQTRILKSDLTNVAAELGENLIPIATDMVEVLGDLVDWFGDLDEEAQKNVITFGAFAAALGPALMAVGSMSKGVAALSVAVKALSKSAMFGPVGIIAAAAAATVGILEFAVAEKEARDAAGTTAQVLKDVDSEFDSYVAAAGGGKEANRVLRTSQEKVNEQAKIASDRYIAMAQSISRAEREANKWAAVQQKYLDQAEEINDVDEETIEQLQARFGLIDGLIGKTLTEQEALEEKISLREQEIERIQEQSIEEGEATDEQIERLAFLRGKTEDYYERLQTLREENNEDEEESFELSQGQLDNYFGKQKKSNEELNKANAERRKEDKEDSESYFDDLVSYAERSYGALGNVATGFYDTAFDTRMQNLENEATAVEQYYDREFAALKKKLDNEEITESEYNDRKKELEQEQAQELYEIELEQFKAQKQADIIRARIASFQLAVQAYKALAGIPVIGPGLGAAAAFAGLAFGQAQVDAIKGQPAPQAPQFAEGGFVQPRPGVPATGDQVPARLNPREVVLTEDDANELLSRIRSGNMGSTRVTVNLGSKTLYDDISRATSNGEIVVNPRSVRK